MLKKKTIIWIVVIAAVVGAVFYFAKFRKRKVEYTTANVKKGELVKTVSASGTLEADQTIALDFEISGRIKEIKVKIGQEVAKGDVIGYLDEANLQLGVDQAKANLDKARADLGVNEDSIHTAKVGVENAEEYLDDTENLGEENIAAAKQKVEDAEQYYDDALSYYNKVKDEEGENSSKTKYAKLTLNTAEANLNQARNAEKVAEEQAELNETSAKNSLAIAEANLKAAKSKYMEAGKNAVVANCEAAYQTALNNLEKAALRAPASGMITKINYESGEVIGSSLAESFAEMISYDFILEADVSESDIAKVKAGMTAEVTFDAFSVDEKFSARVVSIEPSSTVIQDVVYYKVKLALDEEDVRLKDGMSADIDIETEKKTNVLLVPEVAVEEENGKEVVRVLEDGDKIVTKEIKTGLAGDEGLVEVVSGLREGEEVVTAEK